MRLTTAEKMSVEVAAKYNTGTALQNRQCLGPEWPRPCTSSWAAEACWYLRCWATFGACARMHSSSCFVVVAACSPAAHTCRYLHSFALLARTAF